MEKPEPTAEHGWLQQLVGQWTYEGKMLPDDGKPPSTGTETVRMLGELWLIAEAEGTMDGTPAAHIITLGFDPAKQRFSGSFIASMMPSFWIYDGALDTDRKTLRLTAEGPRFDDQPGTALYEDSIEIVSADEHILRGKVQQDDGSWHEFMVTRFLRA